MGAARVSDIPLSKPLRIYDEDLKLLVTWAGETQARTGQETKTQDALHSLLIKYRDLVERQQFISELLDYHPANGETTWDDGFNTGWEAALYVAMGCINDMSQLLDENDFRSWLVLFGDTSLGEWIRSRIGETE